MCPELGAGRSKIRTSAARRGTLGPERYMPRAVTVASMFADHEVTIEAPFEMAAALLVNLLHRDALSSVCEGAYEGGLAAVLRVGPLGGKWGLSKLVRVCFLEPARRGATMTMPLRWEATGVAGELFPVLDADLILTRHGDGQTLLALTGSYRAPFGRAGAMLDQAIMHRLATATIRSLLEGLSDAITHPAAQHQPAPRTAAPRPQPAIEPQEP
jgi:hypothetical protein